jgi:simple sugar transport system permease protein
MPILHSAVDTMAPLLLAALGGLFTELAGMLNIALEGMLLAGAFAAIVCTHFTGSLLAGVLGAVLCTALLAALHGIITLRLRANVFITGLAINLLASGATILLSYQLFQTRGVTVLSDVPPLPLVNIPGLAAVPVLGDLFSGHSWYVWGSWLLLGLGWLCLYRTPFGFRLRGSGGQSRALVSLGLRPDRYRMAAFLAAGAACGMAGSYLSLNIGAFVPNISAGRGWIALVIIFLGNRRPRGLLAAAFVFGLAEAFSNYAQGALNVPADFILAIPYIFTLLVMIAVSVHNKRHPVAPI